MNCRQFEGALMASARREFLAAEERAGLAAHLETCGKCRIAFEGQVRLRAAVGVLAAEASRFTAPPNLEQVLRGELQSSFSVRRRRFVYGVLGGAIAASLAVAWLMTPRPAPNAAVTTQVPVARIAPAVSPMPPTQRVVLKRHRRATPPAAQTEQPFIAIPYTLPLEPYERAEVMRMDLPISALIAAGLPMSMMDPAARAQTDVLVGQDGRARAIRLISISSSN
jgi:hypothetical protein